MVKLGNQNIWESVNYVSYFNWAFQQFAEIEISAEPDSPPHNCHFSKANDVSHMPLTFWNFFFKSFIIVKCVLFSLHLPYQKRLCLVASQKMESGGKLYETS